jgi:hypothetical protein
LKPVGAAKALGVLHPNFFMLWDDAIAEVYCGTAWRRHAAESYGRFMVISADQARACSIRPAERR